MNCKTERGAAMRFRGVRGGFVAIGMTLLLGLAGCGSSSKGTSSSSAASASPVKAATYTVNLTHVKGAGGAASASGVVVLSVKSPSNQVCWSISPIKAFAVSTSATTPTIVTIQPTSAGTPSTPGFPLGTVYRSSACIGAPAAFLGRLEADPPTYFLSVYNTGTGDAVRGQL
jgi:hypothetical protein